MYLFNQFLEKYFKILSIDSVGNFSKSQFVFIQRFNEYLFQLQYRYNYLILREHEIVKAEPRLIKKSLQSIQLTFVNDLESFFEQLYATLCAFSTLLVETTSNGYVPTDITENNEKFLNFLEGFLPQSEKLKVKDLKDAKTFRNEIIHYKNRVRRDWMNFTYPSREGLECTVIYYLSRGPEIYYRGVQLDPYTPEFKPPVNYISFYVSPPHKKIYNAFLDIVNLTLEKITNDNTSRPNSTDGISIPDNVSFSFLPKRFYHQQIPVKRLPLVTRVKNFFLKLVRKDRSGGNDFTAVVQEVFRHK